jgi:cytochrome c553
MMKSYNFSRVLICLILALVGLQSAAALSADRSAQLYSLCSSCHGVEGEGNKGLEAPSIAGLPAWYLEKQIMNFRKGVRGLHPSDGPGMRMRPLARTISTDADVKLVSEYVSKMKRPMLEATVKGNAVKGMTAYAVCSACHGAKGEGVKALSAPPLVGTSDWYLVTQIKNFKAGIRGANAAIDPTGASMAPMAATLVDEQAVKDVVSYIQKLR